MIMACALLLVAAPYEELPEVKGGSIRGRVILTRAAPAAPRLTVTKDHGACGHDVPDDTYVVGAGGAFANVVVVLDGITRGKKLEVAKARLSNSGCRFLPRVSAFPRGTKLVIENADGTLHNTHAYLEEQTIFNVPLPMKGMKTDQKLKKAGLVKFVCDAGHTWMKGWAVVTEHPYVAVTAADGTFALTDVPEGKYTVKAWHEAEGEKSATVTVTAGGEAAVELAF
jgi:hypothetical protein